MISFDLKGERKFPESLEIKLEDNKGPRDYSFQLKPSENKRRKSIVEKLLEMF